MTAPLPVHAQIAQLIKEDWGRLLGVLVGSLRNFELAEDCLQDAAIKAMEHWAKDGVPKAPDAWLITVARRRALDRIRRDASLAKKTEEIAYLAELDAADMGEAEMDVFSDTRAELLFTCCHPALEEKSRLALTLRAVGGLSTNDIASAFLDQPDAMAARLTRAKKKITAAGIPYRVPEQDELPERISGVLRVIYLIFNEGYRASSGPDMIKTDLAAEAIRLGRIIIGLMPEERAAKGLLALMLLHDSRRTARIGKSSEFIPLEDQDRNLWNKAMIQEGCTLVRQSLMGGDPSPYAIQAAISALHAESVDFEQTDWMQIAALYSELWAIEPNPVIQVGRAVALSFAASPAKGLETLDQIATEPKISSYQPYFAARADILNRAGFSTQALAAYDRAIELAPSEPEAAYLLLKRAQLSTLH